MLSSTWAGTPSSSRLYSAFGLLIESCIDLPFDSANEGATLDEHVVFRLGLPGWDEPGGRYAANDRQDVAIRFPGVAQYRVREGREVIVHPAQGARVEDVRRALLGAALGVLVIQRGLLPLHASAVETAEGCVAFVGRSGAGKSTLAAWLSGRGLRVICDDVLVAGFDDAGAAIAWPHAPQLKLWEEALDALDGGSEGLAPVQEGQPKYYREVDRPSTARPLALKRLYVLTPGVATSIRPLQGLSALRALLRQSHGYGRASEVVDSARQMRGVAQLLRGIEVHALTLRRGLDVLDEEAGHVLAHMGSRP